MATTMKVAARPATVTQSRGNTGWCVHCGRTATQELLFHEDGIIVIERYCDHCANSILQATATAPSLSSVISGLISVKEQGP